MPPSMRCSLSSFPSPQNIQAVLDCGAGSCAWLLELAKRGSQVFPNEDVGGKTPELWGMDISEKAFPTKEMQEEFGLRLKLKDLSQPLNEEELKEFGEKFDLVHVRFTLAWIDPAKWQSILEGVKTMLKPGGWLQIIDCTPKANFPLDPNLPYRRALRLACHTNWGLRGNSALVSQTKLPPLLQSIGFNVHETKTGPLATGALEPNKTYRLAARETNMMALRIGKTAKLYRKADDDWFDDLTDGMKERFPKDDEEWDYLLNEVEKQCDGEGASWNVVTITAQKPKIV